MRRSPPDVGADGHKRAVGPGAGDTGRRAPRAHRRVTAHIPVTGLACVPRVTRTAVGTDTSDGDGSSPDPLAKSDARKNEENRDGMPSSETPGDTRDAAASERI